MNRQQQILQDAEGSNLTRSAHKKKTRKKAVLLFCLLFSCYSFLHQHTDWNQYSRLDLLRGIFLYGTLNIDADHENTGDKSIHNGHYYSDKAPGIVFLALPAFAMSLGVLKVFHISVDSPSGWLIQSWITTVGSVAWITALGGVAMFLFLCRFVAQSFAYFTTYAVFLGAAPFPYATMLFSHAAVIGFICIALWAIADERFLQRMARQRVDASPFRTEGCGQRTPPWLKRHLLAGICCGLAISSEYTAALAAGGVLALALQTNWRRGMALAFGAVPLLLLIPAYNWICFGGPLAFGYHHLTLPEFQEMNKGLFGITWPPKMSVAYLILFSPERGLFFWTPFFLVLFGGLKPLFAKFPKLFWVSSIVVVLYVVCISGYYMPNGGRALGPRHLAPMIPFLMGFTALGLERWLVPGCVYALYSVIVTGLGTFITALTPTGIRNPLMDFYARELFSFRFTNTILSWAGFSPQLSLLTLLLLTLSFYVVAVIPLIKRH